MIEFRSVTKEFPDGTRAVEDFSLVIPSHKTTVFVGSSGCGKTTLLRMINRMVEPTGGDIEIDGDSILERDAVEAAPQHRLRDAELRAHAALHRDRQRRDRARAQRRAQEAGARAGADAARHRRTRPVARQALPEPALRRPAAARRRRTRARRRPQHPAHGRAVRRRRPDRARRSAAGAHPAAARARQDGRLRDPRHRRGVPARRPGRDPAEGRADRPGRVARARSSRIPPTTSSRASSASDRGKRALSLKQTDARHGGRRQRRAHAGGARRRTGSP